MIPYEKAKEWSQTIVKKQLKTSMEFKKPRMLRIKMYEELYAGRLRPKQRAIYNEALPIFSGMLDTLQADFGDPISIKFKHNDPADKLALEKATLAWKKESNSTLPNAQWDLKQRWDMHNVLMCGRGIQKQYAENEPKYKNYFEIVSYKNFHCQPDGGGILENHIFAGQTGLKRTKSDLKENSDAGIYYEESVKELLGFVVKGENGLETMNETYQQAGGEEDAFSQFLAMGLDPESNNYVGQTVFYPAEWVSEINGERIYFLFDPFTGLPLRCEKLKDIRPSGKFPWTSWATHESDKVFWSKSYADDFYTVAISIIDLMNQELTNRAKQNMTARGYDIDMVPDPSKLDEASYRPDALIPFDTKNGTKKISDAVYTFTTPVLNGTITLVDWLSSKLANTTGVADISQQSNTKQKVNIAFLNSQEVAKRVGYKANSFKGCWQEVGIRWLEDFKEFCDESVLVKMIGENGVSWEELTADELNFGDGYDVDIVSDSEEDKQNAIGKQQKQAAIAALVADPDAMKSTNAKWRAQIYLRDMGGWDDETITEALDTENFSSSDVMSLADVAIRTLINGKIPDLCYAATVAFANKILHFEKMHQNDLAKRKGKNGQPVSLNFMDYVKAHQQIITENMAHLAASAGAGAANGTPEQPGQGQQQPGQPGAQQSAPVAAQPANPVTQAANA